MNFLQMQQYVSERLLDPSNTAVSLSSVKLAINEAIEYWKFRRFWFNEIYDSAFLTQQDPDFPYPSDYLCPAFQDGGFVVQYSGIRYPLNKISAQQYDAIWLSNGYGIPQWYARVGQDYQCYPIPDRNYQVNRHYLKDYVALSGDSDTNDFTNYASRLINLWALANLSAEIRQDDKMETYFRAAANDEYTNLELLTTKKNATGKLTIASLLTDDY